MGLGVFLPEVLYANAVNHLPALLGGAEHVIGASVLPEVAKDVSQTPLGSLKLLAGTLGVIILTEGVWGSLPFVKKNRPALLEKPYYAALNKGVMGKDTLDTIQTWATRLFIAGTIVALGPHWIPLGALFLASRAFFGIRTIAQGIRWIKRTNDDALRDIADAREHKNVDSKFLKKGIIQELLAPQEMTIVSPAQAAIAHELEVEEKVNTLQRKYPKIQNLLINRANIVRNVLDNQFPYGKLSKEESVSQFEKRSGLQNYWLNRLSAVTDEYQHARRYTKQVGIAQENFMRVWTETQRNRTQREYYGEERENLVLPTYKNLFIDTVAHMLLTHKRSEENITFADIATNPVLIRTIDPKDLLWMTTDWEFTRLWPAIAARRNSLII